MRKLGRHLITSLQSVSQESEIFELDDELEASQQRVSGRYQSRGGAGFAFQAKHKQLKSEEQERDKAGALFLSLLA